MNRIVSFLAVCGFFAASPVFAQPDAASGAAGTTKVAVVNIGYLFSKYERASACKKEVENSLVELKAEAKRLTESLNAWQAILQKGDLSAAKKELYEEKMINARRRLEDMNRTAGQTLGKSSENNLIVLWKDVRAAVKEYATKNGIELVIAHGDPIDRELLDLFPNINRKMQAMDHGGSLPLFFTPGVDISAGVVELLNRQYRERSNEEPAEPEDK